MERALAEVKGLRASLEAAEKRAAEAEKEVGVLNAKNLTLGEVAEQFRLDAEKAETACFDKNKRIAALEQRYANLKSANETWRKAHEELTASLRERRQDAVRDFVRGPVFQAANLLLGASDLQLGFDRAVAQMRTLGAQVDESKLSLDLGPDLLPVPAAGGGGLPRYEGDEFSGVLEIVQEMAFPLEDTEDEVGELVEEGADNEAPEEAQEKAEEEAPDLTLSAGEPEKIEALVIDLEANNPEIIPDPAAVSVDPTAPPDDA